MRVLKGQKYDYSSNNDKCNTFHQQHMHKRTLIGLPGLSLSEALCRLQAS
ncbi:hypothetical protein SAMN04487970_103222 [Paenibacillus tianmuensis]|uniref:Uncharacterized protein n=1 Tax=Paenibacillus tianmuensis TaxID=624147 RepID=A0A1G4SPB9_9BACL|nr:hypothetical protein SAMN04487970_103222 [Paenibacillus tianmuensis]